jgi:hypothetical protein
VLSVECWMVDGGCWALGMGCRVLGEGASFSLWLGHTTGVTIQPCSRHSHNCARPWWVPCMTWHKPQCDGPDDVRRFVLAACKWRIVRSSQTLPPAGRLRRFAPCLVARLFGFLTFHRCDQTFELRVCTCELRRVSELLVILVLVENS